MIHHHNLQEIHQYDIMISSFIFFDHAEFFLDQAVELLVVEEAEVVACPTAQISLHDTSVTYLVKFNAIEKVLSSVAALLLEMLKLL